jgi:hypothetical protein
LSKKEGLSSVDDVEARRVDDFDDVDEKIRGRGDGVITWGEKADPDDKRKARRTTNVSSGRCKNGTKAMVGCSVVKFVCPDGSARNGGVK